MTTRTISPLAIPELGESPPARPLPVKWWAWFGVANCMLVAYLLIRWPASGQMRPTPTGPDEAEPWRIVVAHAMDIASPIAAVLMIYWFVVRPRRREGHLTTDGLLVLAWLATFFPWDPLLNYTQYQLFYSSYPVNFGSWMSVFPGSILPRAHLIPEHLLGVAGSYTWGVFLPMVAGCWGMVKVRKRWPRISGVRLFLVAWAWFALADLILEPLFLTLQLWSWGGVIKEFTIFLGESYQFPLYEPIFFGLFLAAGTSMRFFRNDRGEMFCERGVDQLRMTTAKQSAVRFLAVLGMTVAITNITYNGPMQWIGLHVNYFRPDAPSYMVNGACGPDTPYVCPGPDSPINRAGTDPRAAILGS